MTRPVSSFPSRKDSPMLRFLFPSRARRVGSVKLPPAQGVRYQPRRRNIAALNRNSLAGQGGRSLRGAMSL